MTEKLNELTTEMSQSGDLPLDELSSLKIVQLMNEEDQKVALAVKQALGQVAKAVDIIHAALEAGGRLFYFGAGTSGRLGVLDAAECPPTYGIPGEMVQGVLAGGYGALINAVEGAEDLPDLGKGDVIERKVQAGDVVVGVAASGRTPYVFGALEEARQRGAQTISLSCNNNSLIDQGVDVAINVVVGSELVTGSTRLKAGTAEKMVLNMLSTAAMVKLGKVYGTLMVNMKATNYKLRERAKRIIMQATGLSYDEAAELAELAGDDVSVAIVMQKAGVGSEKAAQLIKQTGGNVRRAIEQHTKA
ncbi:N-acetylmuramic acid 6-phosphate etherase [Paenibacillus frigoriresistens]|uniref:N-acetylmuramic acid 6-phosphate etherase n=1 Tax=Paenibacillus alginolyticus TaxID=59839 RepID=UPI0015677D3D|nr:N-acetylmuramic acid 6-phosphate etherase [Paenibacillus frigoriresistens]NRF94407.1 N-acetylmuramic acid 6-phosphate etherase [Paenibacillus frigoriresistens]